MRCQIFMDPDVLQRLRRAALRMATRPRSLLEHLIKIEIDRIESRQ